MKTNAQARMIRPSAQHQLGKPDPNAIVHPESALDTENPARSRHSLSRIPIQANHVDKNDATENGVRLDVLEENHTGLPDDLKAGIENLSGFSLNDVQVHFNSSQPAQLQALAYAQGSEIHVGPHQEEHLAHEAWHVVQQKQGRVRPTIQARGTAVNDDAALEQEANEIASKVEHSPRTSAKMASNVGNQPMAQSPASSAAVIQLMKPDQPGALYLIRVTENKEEQMSYVGPTKEGGEYFFKRPGPSIKTRVKEQDVIKFISPAEGKETPKDLVPEKVKPEGTRFTKESAELESSQNEKKPAPAKFGPHMTAALAPSLYPVERCREIGAEALKHARDVIPHAGNQLLDLQKEPQAYPRAKASAEIMKAFKEFLLSANGPEYLKLINLHPFIRNEIAQITRGGLCGDYAAVVYTSITRRYPDLPARIVKSRSHGDHAWVEITANDGKSYVVDPWPTVERLVVPVDEFFTTEDAEKTMNVKNEMDKQQKDVNEMLQRWKEFQSRAKEILDQQLRETQPLDPKSGLDVRSTKRSPQEVKQ